MEKLSKTKVGRFLYGKYDRAMMAVAMFCVSAVNALAQSSDGGVASAIDKAKSEIEGYQGSVQNLLYAIAGVIVFVGCFNVYFKMQNGDQDVKKTIMLTVGGCIAMVALANALPLFFKTTGAAG